MVRISDEQVEALLDDNGPTGQTVFDEDEVEAHG